MSSITPQPIILVNDLKDSLTTLDKLEQLKMFLKLINLAYRSIKSVIGILNQIIHYFW